MFKFIKNLRLNIKVAVLGAGGVLITGITLVILAIWQSGEYNILAQKEVDQLVDADLDHITQGVYNLVRTEDEAVQYQVNYNLNVARHVLANKGKLNLLSKTIGLTAINQFTYEPVKIQIPRITIGGRRLELNKEPKTETAVVDEVKKLVGESATIFQRMNKKGDMVRVATTIMNSENKRAIGTYIPAVNPDGTANPVISAILKGETYHGRAFVVNSWYLTAYEPIKDLNNKTVGMLYVGVEQKTVESRIRQSILQTKVGKTGYVYVLGGKNEDRGRYIISQRGERDGEDIWENKDSDERYVIKTIIDKATALLPGMLATEIYRWQNIGEPKPRWKVVRLAYYKPWDWVIGTGAYLDELKTYREYLNNGRIMMINILVVAGLIITLIIGLLGVVVTWTITRPLRQMTAAAEIITKGNLEQTIDVQSKDEIGILAQSLNFMTLQLKQTMEGLRKSEKFLNNIVDNIPDMIFVKDAETLSFVRFNKAGEKLLGLLSHELLGKNDHAFFSEKEADFFTAKDREVLSSKKLHDIKEEKIQTKLWGERILHTKKIPLLDDNGTPQYLLGISEDITEWKKAQEEIQKLNEELEQRVIERTKQLESVNKELKDFAFIVSHDLKAPLRAVSQLAHWIAEDYSDVLDKEGKENIDLLLGRVNRMDSLINGILHYSRIGRLNVKKEQLNLSSLINEVIKSLSLPKHISITTEGEFPVIYGDRIQIEQVFQNLLSNAIKFMDKPNGFINIKYHDERDYWMFSITDNGPGIEEKYFNKVFQIFQTLSPRDEHESTGIGLTIAKKIVELNDGKIWVESEVGKGTTFTFTLSKKGNTYEI